MNTVAMFGMMSAISNKHNVQVRLGQATQERARLAVDRLNNHAVAPQAMATFAGHLLQFQGVDWKRYNEEKKEIDQQIDALLVQFGKAVEEIDRWKVRMEQDKVREENGQIDMMA